jgi:hypothetical protein
MPIEVACPHCQKNLRVGDHVAGKKIRCPACQGVVSVPAEEIVEVAEVYEEPEPVRRPEPRKERPRGGSGTRRPEPKSRPAEAPERRSARTRPRLRKPQSSRDYVHSQCGGTTRVDGPEFQALADPLSRMQATYCSECEEMFPIHEFAWEDTQERISDYYARYQRQASGFQRFVGSRAGMFTLAGVVFVLGLTSSAFLGALGVAAAIFGAIIAIVLHVVVLGPMILRQVLGTADPTQLE